MPRTTLSVDDPVVTETAMLPAPATNAQPKKTTLKNATCLIVRFFIGKEP